MEMAPGGPSVSVGGDSWTQHGNPERMRIVDFCGRLIIVSAAFWRSPGTISAFIPRLPSSVPMIDSMAVIRFETMVDVGILELFGFDIWWDRRMVLNKA